jgi:hypothetical protein
MQIFSAHGHGRSYGMWSRVLARKLPGIWGCGLWPALGQSAAGETFALLTDVGNDIMYEVPVERIVGWLEECLDRLASIDARTVVVGLPIENLPGLSVARYRLFRTLFMPGCSLSLSETIRRAEWLDNRLAKLANERKMKFFRPLPTWYGFDPIHIRPHWTRRAWREITAHWVVDAQANSTARIGWSTRCWLSAKFPETIEFFGKNCGSIQPCARLKCGTTIALY